MNLIRPTTNVIRPAALARQRGAALFMVLMVTLVIVSLSVSMATGVFSEFKISRATADQSIARQGAEAAMRDAELDLNCQKWDPTAKAFAFHGVAAGNPRPYCDKPLQACTERGSTGALSVCDTASGGNGGILEIPIVDASNNLPSTAFMGCKVAFGSMTGQASLNAVATGVQPRAPEYSIEVFTHSARSALGKATVPIYRIRARGYGRSESTTVDLESVYRPCDE